MYSLIYVSSAVMLLSNAQLRELLTSCVRNNQRDGITGMLLYKDGNFMQSLEGEEAVVHATQARIRHDTRHHAVVTLAQGPQAARVFPDWTMGFKDLSTSSQQPAGYTQFLNAPLTGEEFADSPNRAQQLLALFKGPLVHNAHR